jgi:hypothetical protein
VIAADQAELAAMRLILSNVVARLVLLETKDPEERRRLLSSMSDACRLAAERYSIGPAGAEHDELIRRMLRYIDEFFKGLTIG